MVYWRVTARKSAATTAATIVVVVPPVAPAAQAAPTVVRGLLALLLATPEGTRRAPPAPPAPRAVPVGRTHRVVLATRATRATPEIQAAQAVKASVLSSREIAVRAVGVIAPTTMDPAEDAADDRRKQTSSPGPQVINTRRLHGFRKVRWLRLNGTTPARPQNTLASSVAMCA